MLRYILKRLLFVIPTLLLISLVSFAIIQLPPGDFLSTYVANLQAQGDQVDPAMIEGLRQRYGLDDPFIVQYWKWITGILFAGDFGFSLEWQMSVSSLIWDRLPLTIALAGASTVLVWLISLPIGVYSAVRQYSIGDYVFTTIGFLGLATPNFLLALLMMWLGFTWFGMPVSQVNIGTILIAIVVLGTAGTASLIRILRANLLDELKRPYVVAARAQGLGEGKLLVKYPLRVALNPFFSTIGWLLPSLIGGEVIVSTVLNINTTGPLMLNALLSQDMYLAGSIIMILGVLTVIGTFISDIALAWLDPRVRLGFS